MISNRFVYKKFYVCVHVCLTIMVGIIINNFICTLSNTVAITTVMQGMNCLLTMLNFFFLSVVMENLNCLYCFCEIVQL